MTGHWLISVSKWRFWVLATGGGDPLGHPETHNVPHDGAETVMDQLQAGVHGLVFTEKHRSSLIFSIFLLVFFSFK